VRVNRAMEVYRQVTVNRNVRLNRAMEVYRQMTEQDCECKQVDGNVQEDDSELEC
jgi:hypothetical protein